MSEKGIKLVEIFLVVPKVEDKDKVEK